MTSRTKPTAKRSGRFGHDDRDRRGLYLNLAFGLVIAIGVITLLGAAIATYMGSHFAEAAKVNGQTITEEAVADKAKVDTFRINAAESQLRDQNQVGRLTDSDLEQRLAVLEQQRTTLSGNTLDRLVDSTLQGQLATQKGITITDAQIDQRLVDEATQKEQRQIGQITIEPEVTTGATGPTDAQKATAKAAADKALADIQGGKTFEEVAKAVSKDAYAASGGDVGWLIADDPSVDPAILTAAFALTEPGLTGVVDGAGDAYLIGQVRQISPATVTADWTEKIKDAGVPLGAYRDAVRADLVRDALTKQVVAEATEQPTTQRQVSEIFVSSADYQGPGDEVLVKHILYTPGDKAPDAQNPVASDDPGWATAKAKAQATFDKLNALTGKPDELETQFAAIAKTDSLDSGSAANGGELQWFTRSQLDSGFGDAIFKDGLKKDDLLGPVQSQYGYHVILFEERRPPPEGRIEGLQVQANAAGADFAALAKANSDGAEKTQGGDLGWVAPFQLDAEREQAIFAAPIGKVSDTLKTDSGYYVFLVRAEQSRLPDGDQLATLKDSAFTNWFTTERAKADITPDLSAGSS